MTADVVLLLSMKRQWKDAKYQGLATNPKLLGIHYTRSRFRMYAFIHDLTSAIKLPPGGKHLTRGLQLGARHSCISDAVVANADARHQLFYWELEQIATRATYQIPCYQKIHFN